MTLKKNHIQNEPEQTVEDVLGVPASIIDSNEPVMQTQGQDKQQVDIQSLIDQVTAKVKKDQKQSIADTTMTAVPASAYERGGNVQVTPSPDNKAYVGPITQRQREEMIERFKAHTATDDDMRRLDESMIIDLPYIRTASFDLSDSFHPIPKDPSVRFRWVNNINFVQGNMMRLMADGFEAASVDDVDTVKTPIHPKMIDGTQIKQYDVVLMKINVLKLMAIYKRNMETAAFKLDGVTSGNIPGAAAEQSFEHLVGSEPGGRSALNKYRVASGREPVTFSRT
jgi:hypothetical protein